LTSLGAAIYFIYLMAKAKHAREDSFGESETEETSY